MGPNPQWAGPQAQAKARARNVSALDSTGSRSSGVGDGGGSDLPGSTVLSHGVLHARGTDRRLPGLGNMAIVQRSAGTIGDRCGQRTDHHHRLLPPPRRTVAGAHGDLGSQGRPSSMSISPGSPSSSRGPRSRGQILRGVRRDLRDPVIDTRTLSRILVGVDRGIANDGLLNTRRDRQLRNTTATTTEAARCRRGPLIQGLLRR